jgi:hypothetical protein
MAAIYYIEKNKTKAKADSTLLGFVAFPTKCCKNMPIGFAASVRLYA